MSEDIYVWGTGCGAGELFQQGLHVERVRGFVDSSAAGESFMGRELIAPAELKSRDYALVIVTARQAGEIAAAAAELGLPADKLLFLKNNYRLSDLNRCRDTAEALLGPALLQRLLAPCHLVREPLWLGGSAPEIGDADNDYVRAATLEAVCRGLSSVPGAAAELGVYKGGFARRVNALLPERRLYLFDTFCGFDDEEAQRERERGRLGDGLIQAHRNTSLQRVLELMPHPETVTPMPGLFPGSLAGLEERFALVSLDADLEDSTYAGLEYFVPRLSPGGYIFVHDYNSPKLRGVRRAVERYREDTGRVLPALPLCDVNGSLVICG